VVYCLVAQLQHPREHLRGEKRRATKAGTTLTADYASILNMHTLLHTAKGQCAKTHPTKPSCTPHSHSCALTSCFCLGAGAC
jgi:hypothetical protein